MGTWGRKVLSPVGGAPTQVAADGVPEWGPIGFTIDWSTFAAAGANVTWPDGNVLQAGQKGARFGQVMAEIRTAEVQTVDLSGDDDPTGGTWEMTILGETIEDIPYNVSASALEALIRALPVEDAAQVVVSKASFVYTITFPNSAGNVAAITADAAGLTGGGGDTFAITILTSTGGAANAGKFGPYDPAASDGRQALVNGRCFILNQSILENGGIPGLTAPASDHIGGIVGGLCWRDRIIAHATTASLANGPTLADLLAAMPRLQLAFNH